MLAAGVGVSLALQAAPASVALTSVPVTIFLGQSWDVWARSLASDLPFTPSNDSNAKIWNNATQAIVPLVYGPLAGGGNEQQPGNSWIDAAFQAGIGWTPAYFRQLRVSDPSTVHYLFGWAIGGSWYSSAGAFGVDGNWTPAVAGGAYQDMKADWLAFVAALAALGKTPDIKLVWTELGESSAGDSTQAANYSTDHPAMIAQLRTDIIGSAKVVQGRVSSSTTYPFKSTVRAAQEALVGVEVMNMDGYPVANSEHPTAGSMYRMGDQLAYHEQDLWYPEKDIPEVGSPSIYPVRDWELAHPIATLVSSAVSSVPDYCGVAAMTQATAANRPTIGTTALANGLTARHAIFDASNDWLGNASPVAINQSGGFGLFFAIKAGADNNKVIYAESNTGTATPFFDVKVTTGGLLCITLRDDANNVPLSLASLGSNCVICDGVMRFVCLTYNGSTTFTGYVDGTTGNSPQTYNKTAITLNWAGIRAHNINGTVSGFDWVVTVAIPRLIITKFPDAAYIAKMRTYFQREYGTP